MLLCIFICGLPQSSLMVSHGTTAFWSVQHPATEIQVRTGSAASSNTDRCVKYFIFVQCWECWCYSSISWLAVSATRRNTEKKSSGEGRTKERRWELGNWTVFWRKGYLCLRRTGRLTCPCASTAFFEESQLLPGTYWVVRDQGWLPGAKWKERVWELTSKLCSWKIT